MCVYFGSIIFFFFTCSSTSIIQTYQVVLLSYLFFLIRYKFMLGLFVADRCGPNCGSSHGSYKRHCLQYNNNERMAARRDGILTQCNRTKSKRFRLSFFFFKKKLHKKLACHNLSFENIIEKNTRHPLRDLGRRAPYSDNKHSRRHENRIYYYITRRNA